MDRVKEALEIVRRTKALGDYDSHVIGMAAEIIAEEEYGMKKTPVGAQGIDGHLADNKTIQVKGLSSVRVLKHKGGTRVHVWDGCVMLLIILFYPRLVEYEVLYYGELKKIGTINEKSKYRKKLKRQVRLDQIKSCEIDNILEKCRRECNKHTTQSFLFP